MFEDHFKKFRKTLGREALKKLYHVLTLVMLLEKVPKKFLRVIEGKKGLYEIRSEYGGDAYRVFCCFDASQHSSWQLSASPLVCQENFD